MEHGMDETYTTKLVDNGIVSIAAKQAYAVGFLAGISPVVWGIGETGAQLGGTKPVLSDAQCAEYDRCVGVLKESLGVGGGGE